MSYFGDEATAMKFDIKACEMGYPASCMNLSRVYYKDGDYIRSEKLKENLKDF